MTPDASGRFRGITVPELPASMQRCPETGVSIPECPLARLEAVHRHPAATRPLTHLEASLTGQAVSSPLPRQEPEKEASALAHDMFTARTPDETSMLDAARLSLEEAERLEVKANTEEFFHSDKAWAAMQEYRDELLLGVLQSNIAIAEALGRDVYCGCDEEEDPSDDDSGPRESICALPTAPEMLKRIETALAVHPNAKARIMVGDDGTWEWVSGPIALTLLARAKTPVYVDRAAWPNPSSSGLEIPGRTEILCPMKVQPDRSVGAYYVGRWQSCTSDTPDAT